MKIVHAQLSATGNTVPVWVETSSKYRAGLHGMPCDYQRIIMVSTLTGSRTARELHVTQA